MKTTPSLLVLMAFLMCEPSWSASHIHCKTETATNQYVGTPKTGDPSGFKVMDGPFKLTIQSAVSAIHTTVIDRQTLWRTLKLDTNKCRGPYATIYERKATMRIDCQSGTLQKLTNVAESNRETLKTLGIADDSIECAVVLSTAELNQLGFHEKVTAP